MQPTLRNNHLRWQQDIQDRKTFHTNGYSLHTISEQPLSSNSKPPSMNSEQKRLQLNNPNSLYSSRSSRARRLQQEEDPNSKVNSTSSKKEQPKPQNQQPFGNRITNFFRNIITRPSNRPGNRGISIFTPQSLFEQPNLIKDLLNIVSALDNLPLMPSNNRL